MSAYAGSATPNVKKLPKFVIRKDKLTNLIIKPTGSSGELLKKLKPFTKPLYSEEIIYQSVPGDFLRLDKQKLTLVNRQNNISKSSLTVARYEESGHVFKEVTSENISNLIGKDNYELVFSNLCSVLSQEFKIRGILALLTVPEKSEACRSEGSQIKSSKIMINVAVQTEESSFDIMMKTQPRRRVKRQHPTPYVVTDVPLKVNRVVVSPSEFQKFSTYEEVPVKTEQFIKKEELPCPSKVQTSQPVTCASGIPVLSDLHLDEDSCGSIGGLSVTTAHEVTLIQNLDRVIHSSTVPVTLPQYRQSNPTSLTMIDGTVVTIPVKPEDEFHIATPDILKQVSPENRLKLLRYQLFMDWKYCLRRDEDDYLALHTAVVNNDIDLVRRQCLVLRSKEESVDIPTGDNLTALQLSIIQGTPECTALLLQHGCSPFTVDDEYRSCLHLAAERDSGHLAVILDFCRTNARKVLEDHEELWTPELAVKPAEYQASRLLQEICSLTDNQGETPLMAASRLGRSAGVRLLLRAAPRAVNARMTNSGETALFRAVASACHDATGRGNKSKISDDFKKTIELLLEHGADPTIANHSDVNVNTLLSDFSIGELSMLIAEKLTYMNTRDSHSRTSEPSMLIKKEDGTINPVDLKETKKKPKTATNFKNTGKNMKNTSKNTGKGKARVVNKPNLSKNDNSVDITAGNINIASKNVKNTVIESTNTSNVNSQTAKRNESKILVLENKIIKPVSENTNQNAAQSSNQYLNHFKSFVDSRRLPTNVKETDKVLKRKADSNPVIDLTSDKIALANHPRIKNLRKNPISKTDLNTVTIETIETELEPKVNSKMLKIYPAKKIIKTINSNESEVVLIKNKPSTSVCK